MFLPAIEEKLRKEQQRKDREAEVRLPLPDYTEDYERYIKEKEEEKPIETVIQIQIL